MDLSSAYTTPEVFFAGLEQGDTLPPQSVSELAPLQSGGRPTRQSYGPGIGLAVAHLLTGNLRAYNNSTQSFSLVYTSSSSGVQTLTLESSRIIHEEDTCGPYLAALVLGLRGDPDFQKSASECQALLKAVRGWPLPESQARSLTEDGALKGRILQLTNTLYYEVKQAQERFEFRFDAPVLYRTPLELGILLGLETATATPSIPNNPTLEALRLLSEGGSALLYGPAGTFKTESGKKLALELNARLVVMKGDPSVEAREFKGGAHAEGSRTPPPPGGDSLPELLRALTLATYTQNPFQWRDGPLAQAFLSAQNGKTVLLIDEVLRFQSEELGVLMGAMDTVSRAEALILGLPEEQVPQDVRYHLLKLPNEELLVCPTSNLIWILTCNVGRDYIQAGTKLDAALRSRIDVCIHLDVPNPYVLRGALESVTKDPQLINVALALDTFVREELKNANSVYGRPLDARKLIALLRTVVALETSGQSRPESVARALELVAAPYLGELKEPEKQGAVYSGLRAIALEVLRGAAGSSSRRGRTGRA